MDNVNTFFLTQGVLGVIVLVEAWVIIKLYSKTERQEKDYRDLLESRRQDAVQTRDQVTSILPGLTDSIKNIGDKIEIGQQRRR